MSVPVRLAGFAVVLALVFGAAAVAGGAIDPKGPAPRADGHGEGMAMDEPAHAVRGLAVSDGGLMLKLDRRSAERGAPTDLSFRITDQRGDTVEDFDVEHTKRMHVIVVRRDLTGFQHLHPTQRADGSWTVRATLPAAGTYRVFADFSVDGEPHTLADDLAVDGEQTSRALPRPSDRTTVDGFDVVRHGLTFTVTQDGRAVALDDFLGAKGHLVALRQGDLAFLHVHPHADRLAFAADFPTDDPYRLFLQFQVDGRVRTAEFTR